MFLTELEWQNAFDAADRRLELAVDQGFITWIAPKMRRSIACEIATAVITSSNGVEENGDILDGEIDVSDVQEEGGWNLDVGAGMNGKTS